MTSVFCSSIGVKHRYEIADQYVCDVYIGIHSYYGNWLLNVAFTWFHNLTILMTILFKYSIVFKQGQKFSVNPRIYSRKDSHQQSYKNLNGFL